MLELGRPPAGIPQRNEIPFRPLAGGDHLQDLAAEGDDQFVAGGFAGIDLHFLGMQNEAALGLHRPAICHMAVRRELRRQIQLVQELGQRQLVAPVDHQPLGTLVVVGPQIDERVAERAAAQPRHAKE